MLLSSVPLPLRAAVQARRLYDHSRAAIVPFKWPQVLVILFVGAITNVALILF